MRLAAGMLTTALLCFSPIGHAYETIDRLLWPSEGRFPAYPADPSDGRTVRAFVYGGVKHDDNLFRLSDGANSQAVLGSDARSDTVSRAGVGLRADVPVSRQRFLVDAQIEHQAFDRFSVLDHDPYRLRAAWKWAAGPAWRGDASYSRRRYLANLGELQAPVKDLVTEDRAFAEAAYRLSPRWQLRGLIDWYDWSHSDPSRATLDANTLAGTVGASYVTPARNSIGGQIKYTEGEYPNREVVAGSLVDNGFNETETSAVMYWGVTGKSKLAGRLGYTSRKHDQVPQRDFDGMTGRLDYDWFAGAKTLLNFALWREIRSIEDVSASYVLSEAWSIGPSWAPTVKLVFHARYVREDRDFRGDPGFVLTGTPPRNDTFRGIRLAAGYEPRRNIALTVGLEFGDQDSNVADRNYDYRALMANAKFTF